MLFAAVAAAFAAAALVPLTYARWPRVTTAGAVGVAVVLALGFSACVPAVAHGEPLRDAVAWAPALGVELAFRLDGLALAFALLITWIGALVLLYSIGSLGHGPRLGRMLALLLLFLGSMLGLVLADDTIAIVVFWELTSISSFYLIAFDDRSARVRRNATQALAITGAGGLVLLVGALLLAAASGAGTSLSRLAGVSGLHEHALYPAIVIAIAVASFTKSAHVPFHVWLPNAMVAPTPVSTYLHSATMVKAGIYVLARFSPVLGGSALWTGVLVGAGGVTLLTGGVLALLQRDLKRLLAYSTICALGMMTVLIGIGSATALEAFGLLLLAHGAYKAALFMAAGNLDHHRGHRNAYALRGLAGEMPVTGAAAALAAASMAGLPPLAGYLAKESTYRAAVMAPWPGALAALVAGGGLLLVAMAWISAFEPFFRGGVVKWRWREAPVSSLVGPAVLAFAGLAALAPGTFVEPLVTPLVAAIAPRAPAPDLALWHGASGAHGMVLALTIASVAGGTLVYAWLARRVGGIVLADAAVARYSIDRAYTAVVRRTAAACTRLAAALSGASLRTYVEIVVAVATAAIVLPLVMGDSLALRVETAPHAGEVTLLVLAGASAVGAVIAEGRVVTIVCLSVTGTAIAMLFALLSAPDLAITQVVVEALMVILLVATFRHLPRATRRMQPRQRVTAGLVAVFAGAGVALAVVAASSGPDFPRDAALAEIRAAATDGTDNVVNAIVVDYRALDTLGEITVLALSGIGVFALLHQRRERPLP